MSILEGGDGSSAIPTTLDSPETIPQASSDRALCVTCHTDRMAHNPGATCFSAAGCHNEVQDTTYRVGLDRAYRDYYWSASYAARIGRLPYFLEDYVYEDFQAAGMAANVFGFDDLNVRDPAMLRVT